MHPAGPSTDTERPTSMAQLAGEELHLKSFRATLVQRLQVNQKQPCHAMSASSSVSFTAIRVLFCATFERFASFGAHGAEHQRAKVA